MELLIGKENGFQNLSKSKPISTKLPSGARNVKSFKMLKAQGLRKALGDVNQTVQSSKALIKKPISKVNKQKNPSDQSREIYPEIDTFIPYSPLDYEVFDVPEEHKLSHLCLAGVPLWVSVKDKEVFDAYTADPVLSPMEMPSLEYDPIDAAPVFEDICIDLPLIFL